MRIAKSYTTPRFETDYFALPKSIQKRTVTKIKLFEENCFHSSLDTHKLKGIIKNFWSFSIGREYRVVFKFLPRNGVIYYRIGLHRVYKELERMFK